jgi:hypothetical protein
MAVKDPGALSRQQRWLREAHHALTQAKICQGRPILWSYGFGHGGTRASRPYKVYWTTQDSEDAIDQDTVFISPRTWKDEKSVITALIAAELHCVELASRNKSDRKALERSTTQRKIGLASQVYDVRENDIMRVLLLIDAFPPAPFDMMPQKQTTRMKLWTCKCTKVRCATKLSALCTECGHNFWNVDSIVTVGDPRKLNNV